MNPIRKSLFPQLEDVLEPIGTDLPIEQDGHEVSWLKGSASTPVFDRTDMPPGLQAPTSGVVAAQRAIVGALLADNSLFDEVIDAVSASDFTDGASQAAFMAVSDILEGRIEGVAQADAVAVSMQRGVRAAIGLTDLTALAAAPTLPTQVLKGYLSLVREHGAERTLAERVIKAADLAREEGDAEAKSQAIQELFAETSSFKANEVISIGDAAVAALTEMANAAASGRPALGVTTGFEELDLMTAGLHGGQLIILGARPSMGKTALALCMGLAAAASGTHVLVASMEMKSAELSKRAISLVSGVPGTAIRVAALTETQWDHAVIGAEYLAQIPLNILDIPGMKLANLAAKARKLKRAGRLGLILVDYIQIMTPSGKSAQREQQISEISRGLKLLAMELDVPVVALSQLSRAIESRADRRPMLSDLRESGSLEQDADIVIFLHREDMVKKIGAGTGLAEVIVAKQRSGPVGDLPLAFEEATTRFHDADKPHMLRAPGIASSQTPF